MLTRAQIQRLVQQNGIGIRFKLLCKIKLDTETGDLLRHPYSKNCSTCTN
jgi:hypothetical protein